MKVEIQYDVQLLTESISKTANLPECAHTIFNTFKVFIIFQIMLRSIFAVYNRLCFYELYGLIVVDSVKADVCKQDSFEA